MEKSRPISRGMLNIRKCTMESIMFRYTAHQSFGFDVQEANHPTTPVKARWIDEPILLAAGATTNQSTITVRSSILRRRRDNDPVPSTKTSVCSFDPNTRSVIRQSADRKDDCYTYLLTKWDTLLHRIECLRSEITLGSSNQLPFKKIVYAVQVTLLRVEVNERALRQQQLASPAMARWFASLN